MLGWDMTRKVFLSPFVCKERFPLYLTSTDWLILLLSFACMLGVGYSFKSRIKTTKDFLQGQQLPLWICGLGFLGVSLGAPAILGLGAAGAQYGLRAAQFVLLGAIPAMLFAGIFIAPIYYGSKARTVPEYLRLRFDRKTGLLNAIAFAAFTVVSSSLSLYIVARIFQALHLFDWFFRSHGWATQNIFAAVIVLLAVIVLVYVLLGGLSGAIYNHAVQFCLLVAGFLPLAMRGLDNAGGFAGLKASLPADLQVSGLAHAGGIPFSLIGLGILLAAAYFCTDFRVLQTALAAKSLDSARKVPLIAAFAALFLSFLLVLPGMLAISLPTPHTSTVERIEGGAIIRTTTVVTPAAEAGRGLAPAILDPATGKPLLTAAGQPLLDYKMAMPNAMLRFLPTGLLGLGLAALLAGLMSGIAANLTAFNTVFIFDIYQPILRKSASDQHYLSTARWAAAGAMLLSAAAAFAAACLGSIPGALLLALSLVGAPLFAVILLGIFWQRATGHGAFSGLIAGAAAALLHHGLTVPIAAHYAIHGGWIAVIHRYPSNLAQCFWTAGLAFAASLLVAIAVSYCTKARSRKELAGLVRSCTPKFKPAKTAWWKRPETLAVAILLAAIVVIFLA